MDLKISLVRWSLDSSGPKPTLGAVFGCCAAARHSYHSLRAQNRIEILRTVPREDADFGGRNSNDCHS